MSKRYMVAEIYIGLMTGTSADSLDIAAVNFLNDNITIIGEENFSIPAHLKEEIKKITNSNNLVRSSVEKLDLDLGEFFATKIDDFLKIHDLRHDEISAIGSHGQTIKHEPNSLKPFSLQVGDPQLISDKLGIKTIGNFRDDDIEAGGQGAPLSPLFHREVFEGSQEKRVIINIGGITNISILGKSNLIGFDTGPGNCLMDTWIKEKKGKNYDANGNWAKSANCNEELLSIMLQDQYFSLENPKSTGPDYFNLEWINRSISNLNYEISSADVQSTLAELTAVSLMDSLKRMEVINHALYFCGGGIHNQYLMNRISHRVETPCLSTQDLGISPDYLEAVCFAWLAYKRNKNITFDLSEITGSNREVFLGKIYNPIK